MKVIINEQKLLQDLALSFTDPYAVIRELLQNGRRAGATQIDILYEGSTGDLTVRNNGEPLNNFQDLIHVSESGWEPALKNDKPYGLGFLSVIFASTKPVEITSYDASKEEETTLTIDTEALIRGEDIGEPDTLQAWHQEQGVTISLTVPGLSPSCITDQLAHFEPNIVVTYNSEIPPKEKVTYSVKIPQGELQVLGALEGAIDVACGNIPISYQGFQTTFQGGKYSNGRGYIVKLDQILFDARLPDRNFILGYTNEVSEQLRTDVREGFRDIIYNQASAEDLLSSVQLLKDMKMLDALDKLNELPPETCFTPDDMFECLHGSNKTNKRHSWEDQEGCKHVYRSDVVVKVDSLHISEDNRDAFYTAVLKGGSVSTLWGNTEVMTPEERAIPQGAEMLQWYTCTGSGSLANVFVYRDEMDARWMVFDEADLYLNLEQKTHFSIHGALLVMFDYEEDYNYVESNHAEDVNTLRFKIEEYLQMEDEDNMDFNKLFEGYMNTQGIMYMPRAMQGREFTMAVDEKGVFKISEVK